MAFESSCLLVVATGFSAGKFVIILQTEETCYCDCRPEQREGFVLKPNLPTNATKLARDVLQNAYCGTKNKLL